MPVSDLDSRFNKAVNNNKVVGAALGYFENQNFHFLCCGKKSLGGDDPVALDTYFEIGSVTKVFTSLLLMQMVNQGKVYLDEPVESYLPFLKVPQRNGKKITVKHLATHYSGLPSLPTNLNLKNQMNPYGEYSVKDLYHFLGRHTLKNTPGDQFEYSNAGMCLLGHILSLRAGKSYSELLTEAVLAPLSMYSTCHEPSVANRCRMSQGYYLTHAAPRWSMSEAMHGAGGLLSTIQDMTQFLAANLGGVESPLKELLKECHKPQCKINALESIGFGWILSHLKNGDVLWHDGITAGFRSFIGFNQNAQIGIVILANSKMDWVNEFAMQVLESG